MLAILFALSPAFAASNELSFEAGWLGSADPAYDVYSSANLHGTAGLRVGYAFADRFAAILGWQRGKAGQLLYVPGTADGNADDPDYALRSGLTTDQITLGLKADVRIAKWLYPYATVQGDLALATARFDDDATRTDNAGQIAAHGATGGFLLGAGAEFPIALGGVGISIAPYTELGYGWLAPLTLGELGQVDLRGFSGRAGIGLRF